MFNVEEAKQLLKKAKQTSTRVKWPHNDSYELVIRHADINELKPQYEEKIKAAVEKAINQLNHETSVLVERKDPFEKGADERYMASVLAIEETCASYGYKCERTNALDSECDSRSNALNMKISGW